MSDVNEEQIAEVVAAVLAGRPERVIDAMLATMPAEARARFATVVETLASLGLALPPVAPSDSLRARVLETFQARSTPGRDSQSRRALLVIDMIKEHLTPGMPLEVPRAREIVPALRRRLEEARASGTPIVYVVDEHDPADEDLDALSGWGTHAVRGTEGTEVWPAVAPQPGDRVVKKSTYSSFTGSELLGVLDELKADSLIITGCLTEIGVLATATEALQRGFAVEVPADAQAGGSEIAERVSLGVLAIMPPYGPARRKRLEALAAR